MVAISGKLYFALLVGVTGIVIFIILTKNMTISQVQKSLKVHEQGFHSNQFLYHHAVDQLEWLTDFAHKNNDLSFGRPPAIFYDRKFLYHPTSPDGCRYKCNFPRSIDGLTKGDVAVFSASFSTETAAKLKKIGVIVAFETAESPYHMPKLNSEQLNQIDIFITYMASSPVPFLYAIFVRNITPKLKFTSSEISKMLAQASIELLPPYQRNRTKLIVWVVSNLHPKNNRMQFAEAISKFIPVDIFGGKNNPLPKDGNSFWNLSKTYKFYLAFENSNCKDYITEKVHFNALSNNMVPIVLGAYKEDYKNVLPPHSYINVDDFSTIQELTEYLKYLDKNDTAYAAYFAWKKYGRISYINRPDCRLCGFMHNLNAVKIALPKPDPGLFTDPDQLCFNRPLLPLT